MKRDGFAAPVGRRALYALIVLHFLLATGCSTFIEHGAVTLPSLLEEMTDRDAIARFPDPPYTCRQASSFDRLSVAPDKPGWFANHDTSQFIRSENRDGRTEWVMMDAEGPGCLARLWVGGLKPDGKLRIYIDGAETPAVEADAYELLTGQGFVPKPLAFECGKGGGENPGGLNLYLPIPYRRRCKMTYDGASAGVKPGETRGFGFWYNAEYRTYAPGTRVRGFSMADFERAHRKVDRVAALLSPAGKPEGMSWRSDAGVENGEGVSRTTGLEKTVQPGGRVSALLPAGPAAIHFLRMRLGRSDEETLRSTILRIAFDGKETVRCPVGDFFGSGQGLNPFSNWRQSVEADGTLTCLWTMPYRRTARLTVINEGAAGVPVSLRAATGPWEWDERSMHFHAVWRHCDPLVGNLYDHNYVTLEGKGVYAGDGLTVRTSEDQWWGEGDEKIYVDGEGFPSHFGTGTEDYYGYAWGGMTLFQSPFCCQPRAERPGVTVVSRARSLDAIPFTRSLVVDLEVWSWGDPRNNGYSSPVYWYARPGVSHSFRESKPAKRPSKIAGAIEFEDLKPSAKTEDLQIQTQTHAQYGWSNDEQRLVRAHRAGDFVEYKIPVPETARRKIVLRGTKAKDYGNCRISVNGGAIAKVFDFYSPDVISTGPIPLGEFTPRNGAILLRFEVMGANAKAEGAKYFLGLDCVVLE
jgi:hypothetical protein